jgi:hypothetical protein
MLEAADLELVNNRLFDEANLPGAELLKNASSSVWIASGLAKIPALHGVHLLHKLTASPARFMTAVEYAQNPRIKCLPILTSLRGKHPDALGVAAAIGSRSVDQGILLTADPLGATAQLLSESLGQCPITSCALPDRDSRFVNCRSILVLSALAQRLVMQAFRTDPDQILKEAHIMTAWQRAQQHAIACGEKLRQLGAAADRHVIILSDGMSSELSITWQSILSESGITTPSCFDIKDYTHGDHLAAARQGNAMYLVLSHANTRDICRIFCERFSTLYPVINIDLTGDPVYRFWENLFAACNVAGIWTGLLGYPDQRPPKHPVVSHWRGWGVLSDAVTV